MLYKAELNCPCHRASVITGSRPALMQLNRKPNVQNDFCFFLVFSKSISLANKSIKMLIYERSAEKVKQKRALN